MPHVVSSAGDDCPYHWQLAHLQDNTLRAWDMRPYAPANRCVKVFTGHSHTFEKNPLKCDWSPDGSKVRGRGAGGWAAAGRWDACLPCQQKCWGCWSGLEAWRA